MGAAATSEPRARGVVMKTLGARPVALRALRFLGACARPRDSAAGDVDRKRACADAITQASARALRCAERVAKFARAWRWRGCAAGRAPIRAGAAFARALSGGLARGGAAP
jgi:hypothetical protein